MKLALLVTALLLLTACATNPYDPTITNIPNNTQQGIYGSGPNHTKPYPQTQKVNINGVPGAKPHYEPHSRGGNKNYTVFGQRYEVWNNMHSYIEVGTASWYGPGFHGNKTSNGERYNQKGYTAAHKNLPLPSYVKVTNLENGRAVIVRVNDRGPFHGDRIIDLSEGAARAIDMVRKGTAKVKLEYIDVGQNGSIINRSPSRMPGSSYNTGRLGEAIDDVRQGQIDGSTIVNTSAIIYDAYQQHSLEDQRPSSSEILDDINYIQVFTSSSLQKAKDIMQNIADLLQVKANVHKTSNNLYRVIVGPLARKQTTTVLNKIKTMGYPKAFIKRIH